MMKMERILVLLIVYACVQVGGINMACADDPMDKESAVRQEKKELADRYFRLSGKQADYTNLVQSLDQMNARGKRASEVVAALDLIHLSGRSDEDLVEKISACYQKNPYWLVRLKCVEVMGAIDDAAADKYAREMLNDSDAGLESKVLVAKEALKRGKLFGYPVLFEGLISSNKYERKIAEELKDKFESYDGQVYDKKAEKKIEIEKLMKKVREVKAAREKDKKKVEEAVNLDEKK